MMALESQHHPATGRLPAQINQSLSSLALDAVLPSTPTQYAAKLIEERWGAAPLAARLVDLNYDFHGYPAQQGVQQGRVSKSQSLVQALLSNYQTVGAGRFGETAFGLYTPPAVGPEVRIVEIDQSINPGGGFQDYEGIYRQTVPQLYGPSTQLKLQPAEFKKWVWELEFKDKYTTYVHAAWPSDEVCLAPQGYPLRTSVKTAFVMAAYLQRQENSLTQDGLTLALLAAGFDAQQTWAQLTVEQLQAWAMIDASIEAARLVIYRYVSSDIWSFRKKDSERVLLYIPGNSSPFHEFADQKALYKWVADVGKDASRKQALMVHFSDDDQQDGTFHAGVSTALDGMAIYPRQHNLKKGHGFFNDDGYWDPAEYVHFEVPASPTEPFAQWVLVMKQAARASIETIRDDAQVNRDDLSAVVEPVVQWINKFGPLALFVPGGEGLLALAGLIDAGYGLARAVDGKTSDERSAGVTRTVFGLLNALPLAAAGAAIKTEEQAAVAGAEPDPVPVVIEEPSPGERPFVTPNVAPPAPGAERAALMRGIGPSVQVFSDEVLIRIGHVSAVDDDVLRLMHAGQRAPSPVLADTISRFTIDQDLQRAIDSLPEGSAQADQLKSTRVEQFKQRYAALQQSDNEWVRLFQHQYPELPKSAVEQILDRSGVGIDAPHTLADTKRVLGQLSDKARQYEQHVRLCRAYEGLYLKSVENADSDVLVLHTLERLPGWSRETRIEVLDGEVGARVLDSIGPQNAPVRRQLIRQGARYQLHTPQGLADTADFDQALLGLLPQEQRSALGLRPQDELHDLQLKIRENALPRSELMLGLHRMDSGLTFQRLGLHGGGFPNTAESGELSSEIMRVQVKEIYPAFTTEQADEFLLSAGTQAQADLYRLRLQAEQLRVDITGWIEDITDDIEDMDIELLLAGDEDAVGMSDAEIEEENDARIEEWMENERDVRYELAEELIAIWQKRGGPDSRVYRNGQLIGFHLDMDYEQMHSLPRLNVKLNDVVSLTMPNFKLTQRGSLNGFLECFPNLRTLNMQGVDLRLFNRDGIEVGRLPPAIADMRQLESLNLKATRLILTEESTGKLAGLTRLQELDLSENPLGVPPAVIQMTQLRQLKLRGAGLRTCPIFTLDHPYLERLDLRDNRIARVPELVRKQSVVEGNVLLSGNPLTDADSLRWVVDHRKQTGINLWMAPQTENFAPPEVWFTGLSPEQVAQMTLRWERLGAKEGGDRFFGTLEVLTRTADFRVDYAALQQRVWRMIDEMDVSPQLCQHLFQDVEWSPRDGDDPFVSFVHLENRVTAFNASAAKKPRLDGESIQTL
ncbi:dermonecrotic toxin domain-containing protein [Pseudomonas sp. NPDC087697]|uniref:dermonecrotic toxin domain-containing protein n=1 Tax=Pseudomonas sp. NPDC087697 TaxID=3364447 RepID=UPI0038142B02